jgi:hypothetical protein
MATTPAVVKFAYTNFQVENKNNKGDGGEPTKEVGETESRPGEKKDKRVTVKWSAACRYCSKVITETRGTTSGFTRYVVRWFVTLGIIVRTIVSVSSDGQKLTKNS